jgi:hypothetical protein
MATETVFNPVWRGNVFTVLVQTLTDMEMDLEHTLSGGAADTTARLGP